MNRRHWKELNFYGWTDWVRKGAPHNWASCADRARTENEANMWAILSGTHMSPINWLGAHGRHLANTIERSVFLALLYYYFRPLVFGFRHYDHEISIMRNLVEEEDDLGTRIRIRIASIRQMRCVHICRLDSTCFGPSHACAVGSSAVCARGPCVCVSHE